MYIKAKKKKKDGKLWTCERASSFSVVCIGRASSLTFLVPLTFYLNMMFNNVLFTVNCPLVYSMCCRFSIRFLRLCSFFSLCCFSTTVAASCCCCFVLNKFLSLFFYTVEKIYLLQYVDFNNHFLLCRQTTTMNNAKTAPNQQQ